ISTRRALEGTTGPMPPADPDAGSGPFRPFAGANRQLAAAARRRRKRLADQEARRNARRAQRQLQLNRIQTENRMREAARKRYLDAKQARRKAQRHRMLACGAADGLAVTERCPGLSRRVGAILALVVLLAVRARIPETDPYSPAVESLAIVVPAALPRCAL